MTSRLGFIFTLFILLAIPLGACNCGEEPLIMMIQPNSCEPDFNCPAGTAYRLGVCKAARCGVDGDCCPGQRCNVAAGFCASLATGCTDDEDCAEIQGQSCIEIRGETVCGYPNREGKVSAAGTQGCTVSGDCGDGRSCTGGRCVIFAPCDGGCPGDAVCDIDTNSCVAMAECKVSCGEGQMRVIEDPDTQSGPACCLPACACATLPPVLPGQYGWWADIAASDSVIAASAYDAVYGDLVVAFFAEDGQQLSATYVDGFPATGAIQGNPNGPRGGRFEPGDDVGAHTSLAVDGMDRVHVAYHDIDAGTLKYAVLDNNEWATSVVDDVGRTGLYTSIALGPDGSPRIAYMMAEGTVDPDPTTATALKYAQATVSSPSSPAQWTKTVVDSAPLAEAICMGGCMPGSTCVDLGAGPSCMTEQTSCIMCAGGEVCVNDTNGMPSCQAEVSLLVLDELIDGVGLFADLVILADGSPVIAYYDKLQGDLRLATGAADGSFTLETIDGDDPMNPTDVGLHVSVAVAPNGSIGLAYYDATAEDLVYYDVTTSTRSVVDDGITPPDLRMVGADASLVFDQDSQPAIAYQDPTFIDLLYARRTGSPPMWSLDNLRGDLTSPGGGFATGFYACQARRGTSAFVGAVDVGFDPNSNLTLDLSVLVQPLP